MTQESSRTSFSTQAEVSGPHWLTFRDQGTQCPDEQSQKHHVFSGLSLRKVNSTSCSGDAECSMGGTLVRTCCAFCDQTSSVSVPGVSYLPSTVGRNRDNTPWAFLWSWWHFPLHCVSSVGKTENVFKVDTMILVTTQNLGSIVVSVSQRHQNSSAMNSGSWVPTEPNSWVMGGHSHQDLLDLTVTCTWCQQLWHIWPFRLLSSQVFSLWPESERQNGCSRCLTAQSEVQVLLARRTGDRQFSLDFLL